MTVAVVGVVVVTALSACSGSKSKGSSTGSSAESQTTGKLVAELPASTKPVSHLSWALPTGEPPTLDPALTYLYNGLLVENSLCDKLLRLNPDFSLSSNLAAFQRVSPTVANIKLLHDAKFWDGTPVTSADVAFSLTREWKNSGSASNFVFVHVKSLAPVDSKTVRVTFAQADGLFEGELSGPAGAVVEKAYAERLGKKFGTPQGGVMCSGPFEFKSWQPGNAITVTKNPHYWDPNATARADSVTYSFVPNTSALVQGLQSGRFDGAYQIPPSAIPSLKSTSTGKLTLGPSYDGLALWVAHPGGTIGSIDLRKAVMTALNRKDIVLAGLNGAGEPNYTFLFPNVFGKDPAGRAQYTKAYAKWAQVNAYNPSAAKALVKTSGYSGQTLVLGTLAGDATQATIAQIIQQNLAAVGIKLAIHPLQAVEYTNAGFDPAARKGLDFYFGPSFYFYPNPIESFTLFTPGSGYNYTNFNNKQASAAFDAAYKAIDAAEQAKFVVQAQDLWEAQYPITTFVVNDEISFLNNRLTGGTTSFAYLMEPALAYIGAK